MEPGRTVQAFDTSWGRCAMLVCEDAWHSLAPTIAALDGAQLVLIPSATPARGLLPRPGEPRPSNLDRWDRLAQGIAEEHGIFVVVCHLVGFEGGKGFAGGSIVTGPRGDVLRHAPAVRAGHCPGSARFRGDHPGPRRRATPLRPAEPAAGAAGESEGRPPLGGAVARCAGGVGPAAPHPRSRRSWSVAVQIRSPSTPSSPAPGWWRSSATSSSAAASSARR